MEHLFRIVLCVSLLVVYLQAKPVCPEDGKQKKCVRFDILEKRYTLLSQVKCGTNVTFTSPTGVEEPCYMAALKAFIDGLKNATTNCTENIHHAHLMLDKFRFVYENNTKCPLPAQCKWESEQFLKPFQGFVEDMKKFVQWSNACSSTV